MIKLARKDSGEGIVCGIALAKGQVFVVPLTTNINPSPSPPQTSCPAGGCGKCGGCLALASVPNGYARRFAVPVPPSDGPAKYRIGDRVSYTRFIPEPNLMSAVVFGIPVGLALAVMLYWFAVAPQSVESPSAAFSVGAAFFSGILVAGGLDRLFKARYPSAIVRVIDDAREDATARAGIDDSAHVNQPVKKHPTATAEARP